MGFKYLRVSKLFLLRTARRFPKTRNYLTCFQSDKNEKGCRGDRSTIREPYFVYPDFFFEDFWGIALNSYGALIILRMVIDPRLIFEFNVDTSLKRLITTLGTPGFLEFLRFCD